MGQGNLNLPHFGVSTEAFQSAEGRIESAPTGSQKQFRIGVERRNQREVLAAHRFQCHLSTERSLAAFPVQEDRTDEGGLMHSQTGGCALAVPQTDAGQRNQTALAAALPPQCHYRIDCSSAVLSPVQEDRTDEGGLMRSQTGGCELAVPQTDAGKRNQMAFPAALPPQCHLHIGCSSAGSFPCGETVGQIVTGNSEIVGQAATTGKLIVNAVAAVEMPPAIACLAGIRFEIGGLVVGTKTAVTAKQVPAESLPVPVAAGMWTGSVGTNFGVETTVVEIRFGIEGCPVAGTSWVATVIQAFA